MTRQRCEPVFDSRAPAGNQPSARPTGADPGGGARSRYGLGLRRPRWRSGRTTRARVLLRCGATSWRAHLIRAGLSWREVDHRAVARGVAQAPRAGGVGFASVGSVASRRARGSGGEEDCLALAASREQEERRVDQRRLEAQVHCPELDDVAGGEAHGAADALPVHEDAVGASHLVHLDRGRPGVQVLHEARVVPRHRWFAEEQIHARVAPDQDFGARQRKHGAELIAGQAGEGGCAAGCGQLGGSPGGEIAGREQLVRELARVDTALLVAGHGLLGRGPREEGAAPQANPLPPEEEPRCPRREPGGADSERDRASDDGAVAGDLEAKALGGDSSQRDVAALVAAHADGAVA